MSNAVTEKMVEAALNACPLNYFTPRGDGNGYVRCGPRSDDVELMLSAALSASPAQPVAIKPLQWELINGWWFGPTAEGQNYIVRASSATNFKGQWLWGLGVDKYELEPSLEEAKAAAQSDYESRIRSALVPPAVPVEVHAQLALIKHLAEYTTEKNWADKRLYIMQAVARAISVPIEGGDKGDAPSNHVLPLDDKTITDLAWKHFGESVFILITREKSPPMIPQETYDVPTLALRQFVDAIRGRTPGARPEGEGCRPFRLHRGRDEAMSDLIERLRHADTHSQQRVLGSRIFGEAADRIEALERKNAAMREALRDMEAYCAPYAEDFEEDHPVTIAFSKARAALRDAGGDT